MPNSSTKKNKTIKIIILTVSVIIAIFLLANLFYHMVWNGVILLNNPTKYLYPVRGVDVSHYQGDIDWEVLSGEGIDFAFIKATEGSSFVDDKFAYNFIEAQKCDIAVGAYHFFSFDSTGEAQAQNFINTVEPFKGMLPPVIDIEFYGVYAYTPKEKEAVKAQLDDMISAIEEHYGLLPIIYSTEEAYDYYLAEDYTEYDIWIRNVMKKPTVKDGRKWTFWQYTNREKLSGYSGEEKFIDMNVFFGTREEFEEYPRWGLE